MTSSTIAASAPTGASRRGRWIPWAFVGLFVVVAAVNGTMVTLALNSFPGLATEQAYNKGLAFNSALESAEARERLGWQVEMRFAQGGPLAGTVELRARDAAGKAVSDASVAARFVRPLGKGADFDASLRALGDGRYAGEARFPAPGLWELRFEVATPRGVHAGVERLVVQ